MTVPLRLAILVQMLIVMLLFGASVCSFSSYIVFQGSAACEGIYRKLIIYLTG